MTSDLSITAGPRYDLIREWIGESQPPGARLIELGAAPGDQAVALAEAGYAVTALDIGIASDAWADGQEGRMATMFDKAGVDLVEWNLEELPYPLEDVTYDGVLMTEVYEHLRDYPIKSLYEAHRILKPGGRLYFTTPNAAYVRNRAQLVLGKSVASSLDDWIAGLPHARHAREYTFPEIHRLLEMTGFQVVRSESHHFYRGTGSGMGRVAKSLIESAARLRPSFGPSIVIEARRPA